VAETLTLYDEYGIIYEAVKILPNEQIKIEFLEALEAILIDAIMINAHLIGADLTEVTLIRANLSGSDLSNAIMAEAVLDDADLSHANLTSTWLGGALVRGTSRHWSSPVLSNINLTFEDAPNSSTNIVRKAFQERFCQGDIKGNSHLSV